jgi:hypothetical protein
MNKKHTNTLLLTSIHIGIVTVPTWGAMWDNSQPIPNFWAGTNNAVEEALKYDPFYDPELVGVIKEALQKERMLAANEIVGILADQTRAENLLKHNPGLFIPILRENPRLFQFLKTLFAQIQPNQWPALCGDLARMVFANPNVDSKALSTDTTFVTQKNQFLNILDNIIKVCSPAIKAKFPGRAVWGPWTQVPNDSNAEVTIAIQGIGLAIQMADLVSEHSGNSADTIAGTQWNEVFNVIGQARDLINHCPDTLKQKYTEFIAKIIELAVERMLHNTVLSVQVSPDGQANVYVNQTKLAGLLKFVDLFGVPNPSQIPAHELPMNRNLGDRAKTVLNFFFDNLKYFPEIKEINLVCDRSELLQDVNDTILPICAKHNNSFLGRSVNAVYPVSPVGPDPEKIIVIDPEKDCIYSDEYARVFQDADDMTLYWK